jgi:hypothetical protein
MSNSIRLKEVQSFDMRDLLKMGGDLCCLSISVAVGIKS